MIDYDALLGLSTINPRMIPDESSGKPKTGLSTISGGSFSTRTTFITKSCSADRAGTPLSEHIIFSLTLKVENF